MSRSADIAVCAGDLAVKRAGLEEVISTLSEIATPMVLVPGNGESDGELSAACERWDSAHVLHGSGVEIDGVPFWGIGGAVPVTPFGAWSFDLSEEEAEGLLDGCPRGGVLVSHSPPYGHVDVSKGRHVGSRSVLATVERAEPALVVCGHIHACWRRESMVGRTRVINAGPEGMIVEI